jgi:hypothetical protein
MRSGPPVFQCSSWFHGDVARGTVKDNAVL